VVTGDRVFLDHAKDAGDTREPDERAGGRQRHRPA
jgi:hypothetical protein